MGFFSGMGSGYFCHPWFSFNASGVSPQKKCKTRLLLRVNTWESFPLPLGMKEMKVKGVFCFGFLHFLEIVLS